MGGGGKAGVNRSVGRVCDMEKARACEGMPVGNE